MSAPRPIGDRITADSAAPRSWIGSKNGTVREPGRRRPDLGALLRPPWDVPVFVGVVVGLFALAIGGSWMIVATQGAPWAAAIGIPLVLLSCIGASHLDPRPRPS